MATVLESPRNSNTRWNSSAEVENGLKAKALTFLQPSDPHTQSQHMIWEESVAYNRMLGSALAKDALAGDKPLPWRQCAALMILASLAVYGLGFLIVAGFNHLFHYLQL